MKNWIKLIVILAIIIAISFFFYWFELRSAQIVSECQQVSMDRTEEKKGDREDAIYYYKKCLRENGVDK
ncbi:MAG: hypothetical protein WC705_00050 [Candidatus Paceibacterota bacterium]|jgi:uncharacterized protein YxeA